MSWVSQGKKAAAIVFLLCLSACGFQLRTSDLGALTAINISGPAARSEIGQALAAELALYDVVTGENREDAVIVVLDDRESSRRRVATSPVMDAAEYRLSLEVTVSVLQKGETLVAPVALYAQRYYEVDESNLSGSVEEQKLMLQEIREDLSHQIIRLIESSIQGESVPG